MQRLPRGMSAQILAFLTFALLMSINQDCRAQRVYPDREARKLADPDSFSPTEKSAINRLLENRKLSNRNFAQLRTIFADRFKRRFKKELEANWSKQLLEWSNKNPALTERLMIALRPQYDNVSDSLKIVDDIYREHPELVGEYWDLAIAIAVTWDDEKYLSEYGSHARRAKARIPAELTDAADQFKYFITQHEQLQAYGTLLPWEYLIHVVNHRTPLAERQWALSLYGGRRKNFGECYSSVPYDHMMLETQSAKGQLNGKEYTLANLLSHGGVCAHQADFAARVGKSLGIPAEYVRGKSNSGGLHAWVMWVELKAVRKGRISFSLESHGRYRGDKYYVGKLVDPQTGAHITDRILELRLHHVGSDREAKRYSELLMECYPLLRDAHSWNLDRRYTFLTEVIKISPGNEMAWKELASLAGSDEFKTKHRAKMSRVMTSFFKTFRVFPDFTWEVFGDLIAFETDLKKRIKLYDQLVGVYVKAKRPDLACKAQLALAELLVKNDKNEDAVEGLATAIMLFTDDGRSVPHLLDRIEAICEHNTELGKQLHAFYLKFLPRVPTKRGNSPSKHCIRMYERGIAFFEKIGDQQSASAYRSKLSKLSR